MLMRLPQLLAISTKRPLSVCTSSGAGKLPDNTAFRTVHFTLVALYLCVELPWQLPRFAENFTVKILDYYIALPEIKPLHIPTSSQVAGPHCQSVVLQP
jgi:hypothetical protein